MTTRDILTGILARWGFPVRYASKSLMVIRFQMNFIYLYLPDGDDPTVSVRYVTGYRYPLGPGEHDVAGICNRLNRNLSNVKLYTDGDGYLTASSDIILTDTGDAEALLSRGLESVTEAVGIVDRIHSVEMEHLV